MPKLWIRFIVFLTLLNIVGLLSAAEAAHEKQTRTITVQGEGKVSAIPDIATLSAEVRQEGKDLDPVLSMVRKQMNKVLEVVKAQGIEDKDVRTAYFQVRPKYEQDKHGNARPVGYIVANRITIKVRDLKKAGKVLSSVLDAGANSVDGPDFELDNPQVAEREALAAATKDAKAKAQAVADAAGVHLGDIMEINPQNINWPGPRPRVFAAAMASPMVMQSEEPLAAGEQTLTGSVTLTYAIH
jgi:uncharacterized protein YggE